MVLRVLGNPGRLRGGRQAPGRLEREGVATTWGRGGKAFVLDRLFWKQGGKHELGQLREKHLSTGKWD